MDETIIEQPTYSQADKKTLGLTTDELAEIHLTATMFKRIKEKNESPT
jgi:hypothetical protein